MGQKLKSTFLFVVALLVSCSKDHKDYIVPDNLKLQLSPAGSTIQIYVPYAYDPGNSSYALAFGEIVAEAGTVNQTESFFFDPKRVGSADLPAGVSINSGQNSLCFFMSSAEVLNKEILIKFPFYNVTYFSNPRTKPYRIKVTNINNLLSDLKDTAKWEPMPIIKIDSVNKLVHFKSDKLDNYLYCIGRKP